MSDIPKFIKHFKASAAYHRKKAEQAEAEVARLEELLDQPFAQHDMQQPECLCSAINTGYHDQWCPAKPKKVICLNTI